ncbi:MAG TPA: Flp family type IVb pilin [Solimonas sp.]|nr:Flp family type IVb pilin [Solimonas sp.]
MRKFFESLIRDEKGASAVEYGLIVGLIAVALVTVLVLVGTDLDGLFDTVVSAIPGGGA